MTSSTTEARTPSLFSGLRHRDFRYFIGGFTTSAIGSWAYNVAIAVWLVDTTGSTGWLAALTVARFGPGLLMSAYGGVIAERFERVRLMVLLDVAAFVLSLAMAAIVAVDGSPVLVLVLAALVTVSGVVYQPAASAMTPALVPEEDLASANALRNTIDNVTVIAGPGLGGLLLLLGDPWITILANGLTFALSAALVGAVRARSEPVDVTEGGEVGPLRQVLVGISTIMASPTTGVLVGYCLVVTFVFGVDTVQFVVLSEEVLGTGPEGYGYLLTGLGVGGVLAAGLVTRLERLPRLGPVIIAGTVFYCLPTLLFLVVDSPVVAFFVQCVRGASTLVVDVLAITALQRSVPGDRLARVFGAFDSLCLSVILLGSLLVAPVVAWVGVDGSIVAVGLVVPLLSLAGWPLLARMDRESARRRVGLEPRLAVLGRVGLFAEVRPGSLEQLAAAAEEVRVPAGTAVVTQGEAADAFYVIEDGDFSVEAVTEDGRRLQLPQMGSGDGFGEIGLLEAIPRTATVRAATDGSVLRIPAEAFLTALTQAGPMTALLDGASLRLSRTHPTLRLTRSGLPEGGE